jgi:hypothetical protein
MDARDVRHLQALDRSGLSALAHEHVPAAVGEENHEQYWNRRRPVMPSGALAAPKPAFHRAERNVRARKRVAAAFAFDDDIPSTRTLRSRIAGTARYGGNHEEVQRIRLADSARSEPALCKLVHR